jgi:hypothetical protein
MKIKMKKSITKLQARQTEVSAIVERRKYEKAVKECL